jgi:hypothetical protein
MKRIISVVATFATLIAASAYAQQPRKAAKPANEPTPARGVRHDPPVEDISSMAQMTPEMWFYQQESRRWDDPKQAVRRKAEFKAAQRELRIAAMQWYGFSNSRPTVNPTLFSGSYAPGWGSNYRGDPDLWRGGAFYNARTYSTGYGLW